MAAYRILKEVPVEKLINRVVMPIESFEEYYPHFLVLLVLDFLEDSFLFCWRKDFLGGLRKGLLTSFGMCGRSGLDFPNRLPSPKELMQDQTMLLRRFQDRKLEGMSTAVSENGKDLSLGLSVGAYSSINLIDSKGRKLFFPGK